MNPTLYNKGRFEPPSTSRHLDFVKEVSTLVKNNRFIYNKMGYSKNIKIKGMKNL